jgi:hypothetical protein
MDSTSTVKRQTDRTLSFRVATGPGRPATMDGPWAQSAMSRGVEMHTVDIPVETHNTWTSSSVVLPEPTVGSKVDV